MSDPTLIDKPAATPKRPRSRRKLYPAQRCDKCGDEKIVHFAGRVWCIVCDAARLFGDESEGAK